MRKILRGFWILCLALLWLAASVVLGGVALSVKESLGINLFSTTGVTALRSCLAREGARAFEEAGVAQKGSEKPAR